MASRIARQAPSDALVSPGEVKRLFSERMSKRLGQWLCLREQGPMKELADAESGSVNSTWPMRLVLSSLTEARVMKDVSAVLQWVQSWALAQSEFPQGVQVVWEPRQWRLLGLQQVPMAVEVRDALALSAWIGHEKRWQQACSRRDLLEGRFPQMRLAPPWSRYEEVATKWSAVDFSRLLSLLEWFEANPGSLLYQRQLPVAGIDTKWLDTRRSLVRDFCLASQGKASGGDFYEACGLRALPATLRMRVLCPQLRQAAGGLSDIEAPIEDLAQLQLRPRTLLIVENLASGIALPPIRGAVVFMKLGHAISELSRIPWLFADDSGGGGPEQLLYWGDLDTHGFVILARARALFPKLHSLLMDEATLLRGKEQWVVEDAQARVEHLERLTPAEQQVYKALREQAFGQNVRLEQERLAWPDCLRALRELMPNQVAG